MKIAVCCDHGGYKLKESIKNWLLAEGHEVNDFGTNSEESCDYPDFALKASKSVANKECEIGFLFCTTGTGMAMCANKVKGIRCALPVNPALAKLSREHNDANMCSFGASVTDFSTAKDIINMFMNTPFAGGRHSRRVDKINAIDNE